MTCCSLYAAQAHDYCAASACWNITNYGLLDNSTCSLLFAPITGLLGSLQCRLNTQRWRQHSAAVKLAQHAA